MFCSFSSKTFSCSTLTRSTWINFIEIKYYVSETTIFTSTVKNTIISPDFLVWKFCRKAQFPHSFRRIAGNFHTRISGKITVFFAVFGPMEIPLVEHTLNSILTLFAVYAILWNCVNNTNSLKYPRGKKSMCPVNFKRLFCFKSRRPVTFLKTASL